MGQTIGTRVAALDDAAWNVSEWISVKDAPVAVGRADKVLRAADGANWFVATIRNEKKGKEILADLRKKSAEGDPDAKKILEMVGKK